MSVGYFGWVGNYLGWVRVSEGVWDIILGGWGCVGVSGDGWGLCALFDYARLKTITDFITIDSQNKWNQIFCWSVHDHRN